MNKYLILMLASIFLMSFVIAQNSPDGSGEMTLKATGLNPELTQDIGSGEKIQAKTGTYTGEEGQQIKLQQQANNQIRLEANGVGADCDCNLTQKEDQNKTKLYATLSNGKNAEIKIMPDTASKTALEKLRLKNCNESNNCSIELKEVGKDNEAKIAYELKVERQSKVFGLFGAKMNVQTQVDAETGEVLGVSKPWWAFLATEPVE